MLPDATAITTRGIWDRSEPILLVLHDDDGTWQFLPGTTVEIVDGMVVHLGHITDREPALTELADLPRGWAAERATPTAPWGRFACPDADSS